jgi:hypothetical protein
MGGSIDQRGGQRLAAKVGDVDASFPADVNRVHARGLPTNGVDARGIGRDLLAIADQPAEKSPRHGAPANVARADEKNVFHNFETRRRRRFREGKIKLNQVNESARSRPVLRGPSLTTPK